MKLPKRQPKGSHFLRNWQNWQKRTPRWHRGDHCDTTDNTVTLLTPVFVKHLSVTGLWLVSVLAVNVFGVWLFDFLCLTVRFLVSDCLTVWLCLSACVTVWRCLSACVGVRVRVSVRVSVGVDRVRGWWCPCTRGWWWCPCTRGCWYLCTRVSECPSDWVPENWWISENYSGNWWFSEKLMNFAEFWYPEGVHGAPPWPRRLHHHPLPGTRTPLHCRHSATPSTAAPRLTVYVGSPGSFWLIRNASKPVHFWTLNKHRKSAK